MGYEINSKWDAPHASSLYVIFDAKFSRISYLEVG